VTANQSVGAQTLKPDDDDDGDDAVYIGCECLHANDAVGVGVNGVYNDC
jgi:hypothetical protein